MGVQLTTDPFWPETRFHQLSLLACTSNLFYEPPPVFTMSTNALVIVGFFFFKCLFVIIKMNCFTQLEMVHLRNKRVVEVDL